MPFGKYRGVLLSEIDRPYLCYVSTFTNLSIDLHDAVRQELCNRGLGFGKFKDAPLADVPSSYLTWLLSDDFPLLPPWDELVKEEKARRSVRVD
jgi:uncharacterized protein (DUF3820 family)